MVPSRERLLRILSIARDHSELRGGRGLSLRQLVEESGYRSLRPRVKGTRLAAILRAEPTIVDDWLAYCDDKRTSLGWGVGPSGQGGWVVDGPGGVREQFESREAACAEFVLRELDFWADVGDGA